MKKKRLDEIKSKVPELEKGKKMAATGINLFFMSGFIHSMLNVIKIDQK